MNSTRDWTGWPLVVTGIAAMWLSAATGLAAVNGVFAALVASMLTIGALREPADQAGLADASRISDATAMTYAWASGSMAAMYYLTDLSWYHAYQYTIYLAILGTVAHLAAGHLGVEGQTGGSSRWLEWIKWLTAAQAAIALIGAGYLIASGKLAGTRSDWAANHVFIATALAILIMSLFALRALHRAAG